MDNKMAQKIYEANINIARTLDEAKADKKMFNYILGTSKGKPTIFRMVDNEIGTFVTPAKEIKNCLSLENGNMVDLKLPKIPFQIALEIVSFFRYVCKEYSEGEAMVRIYWDKEKEEYFAYAPKQEISKANITFEVDKAIELSDKYLLVMDIHSHNTMGAFFSGTDDKDERENRLYGVFGKIKDRIPQYKFRTYNCGTHVDLDIFEIFEKPKAEITVNGYTIEVEPNQIPFVDVEFDKDWEIAVTKKRTYTSSSYYNKRSKSKRITGSLSKAEVNKRIKNWKIDFDCSEETEVEDCQEEEGFSINSESWEDSLHGVINHTPEDKMGVSLTSFESELVMRDQIFDEIVELLYEKSLEDLMDLYNELNEYF